MNITNIKDGAEYPVALIEKIKREFIKRHPDYFEKKDKVKQFQRSYDTRQFQKNVKEEQIYLIRKSTRERKAPDRLKF